MAEASTESKTAKPRKAATRKKAEAVSKPAADHRGEAKSRFNAALDEAKAGAAALKAEASERAGAYRDQARTRGDGWVADAREYGREASVRGKELATDGKRKTSEAIASLGKIVSDNAHYVDEHFGAKYGDYARSASRNLSEASTKLDQKSVDDMGEDAREFVRKSPGLAIGMAAVAGFMLSRLFSGSRR